MQLMGTSDTLCIFYLRGKICIVFVIRPSTVSTTSIEYVEGLEATIKVYTKHKNQASRLSSHIRAISKYRVAGSTPFCC